MFYKGFDGELCGRDKYSFEVGRTYSTDTQDTWSWYHYTKHVSATLIYFDANIRICEVEPLGKQVFFKSNLDGFGKGYYTTNEIRIVREMTREEIYEIIIGEKCSLFLFLKLSPPFNVLLQYKAKIRGSYCHSILGMRHLTEEQKKVLLPKVWHKHIRDQKGSVDLAIHP